MMSNNIDKRLTELFEKNNIIFWYDDEGKLKEEFDSLQIDVNKLLIDNNQFNIKYQILTSPRNSKFLVYSDKREPKYEDNWLLDLQLKSYIFSADKASMILNDLGLDIVYKPFIVRHVEFFTAKSRVESFVKLIDKTDDAEKLALKMLAVLSKCNPKIEQITINLMTKEKAYAEICKFELDDYLWKNIKYKYKYDVENPTFKDFAYKLLQNHFYSFWDKSRCELNKEAILFVKNWMDSSSNKDSFRTLSKTIQDELSIATIIQNCNMQDMIDCDTYELCEQMLISNISKILLSNSTSKEKIIEICTNREHTFWYGDYENIYKAFLSALQLIDSIKTSNLLINSFDDGFEKYANELSKIDYYYRKYINHSNKSEHNQILKTLDEQIEKIYLNDFLRVLNDTWQSYVKDYKSSKFDYQKDFYKTNINPIILKEQKVFVIISDALRYECAVELKNKILGLNRYSAEIKPMVGVLPSFTQLGIASLLPNDTLSFDSSDDSVYVNNISSRGTKNRDKILKKTNDKSVYIDSESFLDLNRNDGREFSKANQVIYIYHNEIDATGDKKESEHKVFNAVEDSFITIQKIIKQISNMNGSNIFITADHGFLYQDTPTLESEFFKVEKAEDSKRFNRRFIIGSTIQEVDGIDIFDAKDLNILGNEKIALAKSINKIRLQGGGNRFVHGGASLQEMVVPLISVKKTRKDDVVDVDVSCIPISQITTNSVMLSFYQEEPISDKIKPLALKIAFYTKDNKLISNFNSYSFNSIDTHDRNREVKLKFDLKQNASDYSGQNIKVVMKKLIEDSNEEPMYKEYEIKLQLSFINDFDDF
jgi:uncharacterized protein (TIGR02687 family)